VIGLDTNVLLRFLTEDDPKHTPIAQKWIREAISREEKIFLSGTVLCEVVWVLSRSYKFTKAQLLATLEELLSTTHVDVEDHEVSWNAVHDYAFSNADFADCLIRRKALAAGCSEVKTFDQKLLEARLV
jgi:predicted nucleic-acid-binding protein